MDGQIALSWVQLAAIVGPLTGSIGTLFWLLIASKDRAIKRAEDKEDEERRIGQARADKLIATAEQFGEVAKQMAAMYREDLPKRGGRSA